MFDVQAMYTTINTTLSNRSSLFRVRVLQAGKTSLLGQAAYLKFLSMCLGVITNTTVTQFHALECNHKSTEKNEASLSHKGPLDQFLSIKFHTLRRKSFVKIPIRKDQMQEIEVVLVCFDQWLSRTWQTWRPESPSRSSSWTAQPRLNTRMLSIAAISKTEATLVLCTRFQVD